MKILCERKLLKLVKHLKLKMLKVIEVLRFSRLLRILKLVIFDGIENVEIDENVEKMLYTESI